MLIRSYTPALLLVACILLGTMVVHSLKMSKSSTNIVADNELNHLRTHLLAELINQIKESIAIGRSCHEQLRLLDGQELVESGQNLLVMIKSREKDFASIFGDTPEIIDRIVSSIEQKVLVCNAEGNRQLVNSLLKIYSRPLFQNETLNITTMLKDAMNIAHNLTTHIKVHAAKPLLLAISEQIDQSAVLAERYSLIARSMTDNPHRASNTYYYMLLSQALSDSFQKVLASLYHFSNLMWQVYIQDSPKTALPLTLYPLSLQDQQGIETFLQTHSLLVPTVHQASYQVYHSKFRVKSQSASFLFYVQSSQGFVLKVDNDIGADIEVNSLSSVKNPYSIDEGPEFTCEAYLEENTVVDIYLYILAPPPGSDISATGITPPRLLVARETTMEASELKLKRVKYGEKGAASTV